MLIVVGARLSRRVAPVPRAGGFLGLGRTSGFVGSGRGGQGEYSAERAFEVAGAGPGLRDLILSFRVGLGPPDRGVQDAVAQGLGSASASVRSRRSSRSHSTDGSPDLSAGRGLDDELGEEVRTRASMSRLRLPGKTGQAWPQPMVTTTSAARTTSPVHGLGYGEGHAR